MANHLYMYENISRGSTLITLSDSRPLSDSLIRAYGPKRTVDSSCEATSARAQRNMAHPDGFSRTGFRC